MRTRSLSQRQLPRRPRQHTSQNIVQEDDVYVPSDSEESAQSTETEDVEPEQHRPSQATRSHNRKALSLETEDLDERISGTIEELQGLWRRAQAENKDLSEQLAKLKARKPQPNDSPRTRRETEMYIKEVEDRVYSLHRQNAALRLENRALLKQARKGKRPLSVSDSDSEDVEERDSSTALNSDAVALAAPPKSQQAMSPEIAVFESSNSQRANASSSSPGERTMKLLLRRATHAMNEIARYDKMDCEACLTRRRIRWRLPCGHALCHACIVGAPSSSTQERRPCAVCKRAFAEREPVPTGKVLEDEWATLRAVARKWRQLDHGPLDERDKELEAELALLREKDDGEEEDDEDDDGVGAGVVDEDPGKADAGRVEVEAEAEVEVIGSSSAPTRSSRSSSLATPPMTPPPSYSLRKRKRMSYRIPSRSASPGEDPDVHPGSTAGLQRFSTKRKRVPLPGLVEPRAVVDWLVLPTNGFPARPRRVPKVLRSKQLSLSDSESE